MAFLKRLTVLFNGLIETFSTVTLFYFRIKLNANASESHDYLTLKIHFLQLSAEFKFDFVQRFSKMRKNVGKHGIQTANKTLKMPLSHFMSLGLGFIWKIASECLHCRPWTTWCHLASFWQTWNHHHLNPVMFIDANDFFRIWKD